MSRWRRSRMRSPHRQGREQLRDGHRSALGRRRTCGAGTHAGMRSAASDRPGASRHARSDDGPDARPGPAAGCVPGCRPGAGAVRRAGADPALHPPAGPARRGATRGRWPSARGRRSPRRPAPRRAPRGQPAGGRDARRTSSRPTTSPSCLRAGGRSDTVAIVDAYDDPNAESDLGTFRSTSGLAACTTANGCFRKVNQSRGGVSAAGRATPAGRRRSHSTWTRSRRCARTATSFSSRPTRRCPPT